MASPDLFFEVSWEVCNKVGGIYTVISSKAALVKERYGENYFLIGPYFPQKATGNFVEEVPSDYIKYPCAELAKEGILVHYGKWLVKGNPNVVLVEFSGFAKNRDEIKKELWDWYKIDSLNTEYFDFDEPVIWAYAVGKILKKISETFENKKIAAQFHEWLSGAALLYLKKNNAKVGAIFTTHATMLGRTLASTNIDLYNNIKNIDDMKEAYSHKIHPKHQMEQQCALNADVFTTVSEITGIEAEHFLKRKPDILLPNGLDFDKFPTFEEISIKHKLLKNKIKEFLIYYFFPYYSFDLDETLIYFLAGRYEFHDKGIDIFIKSLGRLNERLKKEKSKKTIVAFFWVPGNIRGIKPELLENRTYYNDIKNDIDDEMPDVENKMIYLFTAKEGITGEKLFDDEFFEENNRKLLRFLRKGKPPLSTHDIYNEDNDLILIHLKLNSLNNDNDDRVKVVYYPIYLTGADGLLDTSYYQSMQGSHLGVFPSFYEPWGYTPLEAAGLGVSSVTTDLAGFGRYIEKNARQDNFPGIFLLRRFGKTDEEVTAELAGIFYDFCGLSKQDRIANKIGARKIASLADWKFMIKNYFDAHDMAVSKIAK